MRVIILAAGQGKRLGTLNNGYPKCLLKINGETLIQRLLNQFSLLKIDDITIVVGYQKRRIIDLVKRNNNNVKFVYNDMYKEDINIYSLKLALEDKLSPFYLFEADCILEKKCFNLIFDPKLFNKSVWFTNGLIKIGHYGGIIISDTTGKVIDFKIISEYHNKYKKYNKLAGVLKVGKYEIEKFTSYLFKASNKTIKQYYHLPWINNLHILDSVLCELGNLKIAGINTKSDYELAKKIFENSTFLEKKSD